MKKYHTWDTPLRAKGIRESNEHFELFRQYDNMGPNRSIRQLYKLRVRQGLSEPKLNFLYKLSSKYKWRQRVKDRLEWQATKATEKNLEMYLTNYEQGLQRSLARNNILNRLQELINESVQTLSPQDKQGLSYFQILSYLFTRISSFHNSDIYEVGGLVELIDKIVKQEEAYKQHHNEYVSGDKYVSEQIKLIDELFDKYAEE